MAYTPKRVSVAMPNFEFGTAKYIQGLQTAKDDRAAKERAEARLDLQDQRQLRQDELTRMRLQRRDKVADANIARANYDADLKNALDAKERERVEQTKAAAWDVVNNDNTFTLDDYKKQAPNLLIPLEGLETEQRNAVAYLQDAGDTVNSLDTAMNSYKHNIGDDYSLADVTAKAQQRRLELEEYRKMVSAAATPEKKAALVKKFVTTMYTPRLNVVYSNIARGRGLPISVRQQILDSRVIPKNVRKSLLPSDVANLHKRALVGAVSRDALYSKETARLKEEYDRQTDEITGFNEYIKRKQAAAKKHTGSGTGKSSSTGSIKGTKQAMEDVAAINLRWFGGSDDAKRGYQLLIDKYNISPEVASMVVGFNVEDRMLGKDFPSVTDDAFIGKGGIVDQAKALKKALSSKPDGKGGSTYSINKSKYRHHASKRRSVDDLLAERFGAGSASNAIIPLTLAARARIKAIVAEKPTLSGSTSSLWGDVKNPPPPTESATNTKNTRIIDDVKPLSMMQRALSQKAIGSRPESPMLRIVQQLANNKQRLQ